MLYAPIAVSTNGDNTIVTGVPRKRIRLVAGVLSFSGTVNARWKSGASLDLSGLYYGVANVLVPFDYPSEGMGGFYGHLETAQGDDLVLNLSAGVAVGGHIVYLLVN